MLKDGHKQYSGVEGVVLRNVDACKKLSKITRTSLGPNGSSYTMLKKSLTIEHGSSEFNILIELQICPA
jgi:T-complex protein 1 subunit theta